MGPPRSSRAPELLKSASGKDSPHSHKAMATKDVGLLHTRRGTRHVPTSGCPRPRLQRAEKRRPRS